MTTAVFVYSLSATEFISATCNTHARHRRLLSSFSFLSFVGRSSRRRSVGTKQNMKWMMRAIVQMIVVLHWFTSYKVARDLSIFVTRFLFPLFFYSILCISDFSTLQMPVGKKREQNRAYWARCHFCDNAHDEIATTRTPRHNRIINRNRWIHFGQKQNAVPIGHVLGVCVCRWEWDVLMDSGRFTFSSFVFSVFISYLFIYLFIYYYSNRSFWWWFLFKWLSLSLSLECTLLSGHFHSPFIRRYGRVRAHRTMQTKNPQNRPNEWRRKNNQMQRKRRRRRQHSLPFTSEMEEDKEKEKRKNLKEKMPKTAEVLFFLSVTLFSSRLLIVVGCVSCVCVCAFAVCIVLYHYFYRRLRSSIFVAGGPPYHHFKSIAFYCDVKWTVFRSQVSDKNKPESSTVEWSIGDFSFSTFIFGQPRFSKLFDSDDRFSQ